MHLLVFAGLFGTFGNSPAFAQTNTSLTTEFSAQTGPFLPKGITGVTEMIPMAGGRISQGIKSFRPELTFLSGRTSGSTYYLTHLSVRNWLKIEDLQLFWLMGIQASYYQRSPSLTTGETYPFKRVMGWHFGFGLIVPVANKLHLRSDFYFHNSPGFSAMLLLGISIPINFFEASANE